MAMQALEQCELRRVINEELPIRERLRRAVRAVRAKPRPNALHACEAGMGGQGVHRVLLLLLLLLLLLTRKVKTERPPVYRAVPLVGSTWLGPAP